MKYAKRQQLIGCYGTILSAQSKELFFFIMFANRLEFVWTWIQRKFIFSKISLYTAPKRLIEKVILPPSGNIVRNPPTTMSENIVRNGQADALYELKYESIMCCLQLKSTK